MTKSRAVLVLAIICSIALQATTQTQHENILKRQSDESARSREDRQQALTTLLATAQQVRDLQPVQAARYLNRAGRLQFRLNSSQDALASYQDALTLLDQADDFATRIDTLNGIAAINAQLTRCGEAQKFIDQALTLSNQHNSVAGRAEALLALSDCQNLSDHGLAAQTAEESLQLWQTIGDRRGVARAYAILGDIQITQNNLIEATKSNEAVLGIWRELNVPDEQAGALISLGFIEYRKGAWQSCMSLLTQAQALLDENAEPFRMGQISAGIAEAFIESGMPEAGLTKAKEAVEYYQRAEDPRGVAATTWDMGKAYYFLGNNADAIMSLQQAMKRAESIQAPLIVAFCHDFLGRTYAAMGDQATALQSFQTALTSYSKLGNSREAARAQALIGRVYEAQGNNEVARENFLKAITTFASISDRVNQSAALYALGRLELKANNLDRAEEYLRQSIEVTENIRRESTSADLMVAFSAKVHERYQSYIECQMRLHEMHPDRRLDVLAFETSELARARSLTELLRSTQTTLVPGKDQQLAEQEKSLRQTLRVKEDAKVLLLSKASKKEDLTALEAELNALEAKYKKVDEEIKARFPSYARMVQPTSLSLEQIQNQIFADDQTALLEYSLGPNKSYVWVVTRTSFSSYELPAQAEIEDSVRKLYHTLTEPRLPSSETARQDPTQTREADKDLTLQISALSKILLGPIASKLNTKRLLIVADGPLQYIPFQILTSPLKSEPDKPQVQEERALVLDHEIVCEPSASALTLFLNESATRQPGSKSVAILADPVFDLDDSRISGKGVGPRPTTDASLTSEVTRGLSEVGVDGVHIPRLLSSRDEAAAIMSVVPWRTGFEAVDFDASRATALSSALSQYRMVHFATHALVNNEHPELSGIVLSRFDKNGHSQDGYLRLQDIYSLNLPVDLVVLSACQTGLGKDVNGEGLIGLTRGFMYAGASGVVASLWKVDDEATAELMKHFYEGLFDKGLSPAAALREAQLSLRQQKRWQEPYYWAGFVIQGQYAGNFRTTSSIRPAVKLVGLGALVGLLGSLGFIALNRRRRRIL